MTGPERALYCKLSAFFFLYYGAVGIFLPYWPLYLLHSGYTAAHVGAAFAVLGFLRIWAPLLWGRIMDARDARMPFISAAMAVCVVLFALVPLAPNIAAMLALHAAYAIFWNAALPAFDVVTMRSVAGTRLDYSRIRLWGSVGFVITVVLFGALLDRIGPGIVPWSICVLMAGMALLGATIRDTGGAYASGHSGDSLLALLRRPVVIALLLAGFLAQFSFSPFYTFFSVYLRDAGYSSVITGWYWALGVGAEVIVFWFAGSIVRRFGVRAVLLFAVATTAARWAILALLVDDAAWLSVSQILHLSSFGLYHTATVLCVHRLFPARLHGQGQALLAGLSFGLGGSLGSLLAGRYWDSAGGEVIYLGAAVAAAVGFVVVLVGMRAPELQRNAHAAP